MKYVDYIHTLATMDIRELYNNAEDSDVSIILSDGTKLYAHCVILKHTSVILKKIIDNRYPDREYYFPDYSDESVKNIISSIYGLTPIIISKEILMETMRFAVFLELFNVCDILINQLPTTLPPADLFTIGFFAKNHVIDKIVFLGLTMLVKATNESIFGEYMTGINKLELSLYKKVRDFWIGLRKTGIISEITLLKMDCTYCDIRPGSQELLGTFIKDYKFDILTQLDVKHIISYPIIKDNELLKQLFTHLCNKK